MILRRAIPALAAASLLAAACPAPAAAGPVMRFAERQLARTHAEVRPGRFPNYTTRSGHWHTSNAAGWTSGFFPGELWLAHRWSGRRVWARRAARRQTALAGQASSSATHDVGFIVLTSYGAAWRATHESRYRRVLLRAGASLASRFNGRVGATRSWGRRGGRRFTVIVDNLMNIQLLFWGARHGGPAVWREMAHRHALTTLRNHVRPDGSTFHVVDFDARTGAVLRRRTKQGAADDSTWARGQAWAIYGLAASYGQTHDPRLLRGARRVARWWLRNVPSDHVPYWDFDARLPAPRDSSAAAVAASGLLDLARRETSRRNARRYKRAAVATLRSLASPRFLARGTRSRSILLHGTANEPRGSHDTGLVYGDYYFLEGLLRARLDP